MLNPVFCGENPTQRILSVEEGRQDLSGMINVNFVNFLSLLKGGDDIVALQEKRKS